MKPAATAYFAVFLSVALALSAQAEEDTNTQASRPGMQGKVREGKGELPALSEMLGLNETGENGETAEPKPLFNTSDDAETPDRPGLGTKTSQPKGKLPGLKDLFGRGKSGDAAAPSTGPQIAPDGAAGPPEQAVGIGGVFFSTEVPDHLKAWYKDNLGTTPRPEGPGALGWADAAATTFVIPFAQLPEGRRMRWMVSYRVRDLAAITTYLRGRGIEVETDAQTGIAQLTDPDGNPIKLVEGTAP